MEGLARRLARYHAYHRDVRNRWLHAVGVPAIVASLFYLGSWVRVGPLSLSTVLVVVVSVGYVRLDPGLGILTGLVLVAGLALAEWGRARYGDDALLFLSVFATGWVFQFVGHALEGRRPALVDDLSQALVAPIYLVAELVFALGGRRGLRGRVRELDAAEERRA